MSEHKTVIRSLHNIGGIADAGWARRTPVDRAGLAGNHAAFAGSHGSGFGGTTVADDPHAVVPGITERPPVLPTTPTDRPSASADTQAIDEEPHR